MFTTSLWICDVNIPTYLLEGCILPSITVTSSDDTDIVVRRIASTLNFMCVPKERASKRRRFNRGFLNSNKTKEIDWDRVLKF